MLPVGPFCAELQNQLFPVAIVRMVLGRKARFSKPPAKYKRTRSGGLALPYSYIRNRADEAVSLDRLASFLDTVSTIYRLQIDSVPECLNSVLK
jgi:hypothetical protein